MNYSFTNCYLTKRQYNVIFQKLHVIQFLYTQEMGIKSSITKVIGDISMYKLMVCSHRRQGQNSKKEEVICV